MTIHGAAPLAFCTVASILLSVCFAVELIIVPQSIGRQLSPKKFLGMLIKNIYAVSGCNYVLYTCVFTKKK